MNDFLNKIDKYLAQNPEHTADVLQLVFKHLDLYKEKNAFISKLPQEYKDDFAQWVVNIYPETWKWYVDNVRPLLK